MRSIKCLLVLIILLFAPAGWSFTVIFKDGRMIEGIWMGEDQNVIRVKDQSGVVRTFNKSQLDMKAMTISSRLGVRNTRGEVKSASAKLTGLTLQENEILILGNGELNYSSMELDSPSRLVIDFLSATIAPEIHPHHSIKSAFYSGVRVSQFDPQSKTARVVIDLKQKVPFYLAAEGSALHVRLGTSSQVEEKQLSEIASLTPSVLPIDDPAQRSPAASGSDPVGIPEQEIPKSREFESPPLPKVYTKRWSMEAGLSNVYESNINHDEEDIVESVGVVSSVNTRFRNRVTDPNILLRYEIGYHEYSNTDQWDRISHNFRAAYLFSFGKKFVLESNGEVALNGSSEDRELGDQYSFRPVLNYNINSSTQLDVIAAYRYRKFENGTTAINRFAGVALTKEFDRHEITGYYRYEYNNSDNFRNDRYVYTYFAGYTMPIPFDSTVSFGARLRNTRYLSRLVDIEQEDGPDIEFLRRDKKWNFEIAFGIPLGQKFELVPEYEYEYRTSNDPDKPYDAHEASLSLVYSLW